MNLVFVTNNQNVQKGSCYHFLSVSVRVLASQVGALSSVFVSKGEVQMGWQTHQQWNHISAHSSNGQESHACIDCCVGPSVILEAQILVGALVFSGTVIYSHLGESSLSRPG